MTQGLYFMVHRETEARGPAQPHAIMAATLEKLKDRKFVHQLHNHLPRIDLDLSLYTQVSFVS